MPVKIEDIITQEITMDVERTQNVGTLFHLTIGGKHRRSQFLAIERIQKICRNCGNDFCVILDKRKFCISCECEIYPLKT